MASRFQFSVQFLTATAVLTRLPVGVGAIEPGAVAAASWAFPLVGAGIGGIAGMVYAGAQLAGCSDPIAALLALAAGAGLTGALHEDGLADTADGFGGGHDRDRKLAIMHDSQHGTYGILALLLSLGLRAAALAVAGDAIHAGLALVAAHALSRGLLPAAMRALRPARQDGLGASAGTPSPTAAGIAFAIGIVVALAGLGPGVGAIAIIAAIAGVSAAAMLAQRQIGGYTGDVLGAFQQIGEIIMLLAAAAR
jgi:adenosylcobinamide-GDP ribazoletransferase